MTATAHSAKSLQELAPNIVSKVRDGDLAKAPLALLAIGAILVGAAWATGGKSFYASYLVGYMGTLGICLGALFFTMVQHITRAGWSVSVRRFAENTAAALPVMAILFVPVLLGFGDLYHHWNHIETDATKPGFDAVLHGKASWLNPTAFYIRAAIYFVIWIGLATYFRGASLRQDESGDPAISLKLSRVAAPGLLLFALSTTFAAFDWIMSLDPHWFSTIFGVTYFAGGYMSFLAFTIVMGKWLGKQGYLKEAINTEHYHDLGKLLFAFMVFWTYTNFSQYMLIWYANLPEETRWFAERAQDGWLSVGTILIFGHFLFPFAFLMSRHIKRNALALPFGALFLLVLHCIDMQYLILPTTNAGGHDAAHGGAAHAPETIDPLATGFARFPHEFSTYLHNLHWADFGCYLGLVAILAGLVLMNVRRTNLVPLRDPRLAESLHFQNF